jgi:hypothetical protein
MAESNDSGDFIDRVKAANAKEAARERSIQRPPRPHGATKTIGVDSYVQKALDDEIEAVATAPDGALNTALNTAGFNLGQIVATGALDFNTVCRELTHAARGNGYPAKRLRSEGLPERAVHDGMEHPRDLSEVGTEQQRTRINAEQPRTEQPHRNGKTAPEDLEERTFRLKSLATVKSRVPTWVWEYNDIGRIQHGTLSMFAGKPSAGKSTAVRWFAARLSKGELPGVWFGHPMKVAVVMTEEQTDAIVVPGLQAAGADMHNIFTPDIHCGAVESTLTVADENKLTEMLIQNEVAALFVDPIMSMVSGKADIYRNNEMRIALAPFTRIAKAINGIVIGVAHLKKGEVKDVLGGINGSSAFGEVPRAVFGFAPTDGGEHVMEQVKNSAGPMGLKLSYKLPVWHMLADDGQPLELPRFEITGETEISISDIDTVSDETTNISVACQWLSDYLQQEQPASSAQVKRDAKQFGDIKEHTLKRAMKRLGVTVRSYSEPDKPHMTKWSLPGYGEWDE